MGRRVLLPRPSAWSCLAPTPLAVCKLSPALLAQTRRSATPTALPRLPSVPPWIGRPPNREHRTRTSTRRERSRRSEGEAGEEEETKKKPDVEAAREEEAARDRKPQDPAPYARPSFMELGSDLCSAPFFAPPPFEAFPESSRRGGVPSLRPPHTVHPPIGSELPHPFPSHQARRDSGGSTRRGNSGGKCRREIQAGNVLSGPRKSL